MNDRNDKIEPRGAGETLDDYAARLRDTGAFDAYYFPEFGARAKLIRELKAAEAASDWPGRPPYVLFRKVRLEPASIDRLVEIGPDAYAIPELEAPPTIRMAVLGPDNRGANAPPEPRPRGYRREEYETYTDALLAASMSTAEMAVARWRRDLRREHAERVRRQRQARNTKFGRAETLEERNARHRQAHAESGQSANKYAELHDGEDGLSKHQLRRIVSQRAVAQKP